MDVIGQQRFSSVITLKSNLESVLFIGSPDEMKLWRIRIIRNTGFYSKHRQFGNASIALTLDLTSSVSRPKLLDDEQINSGGKSVHALTIPSDPQTSLDKLALSTTGHRAVAVRRREKSEDTFQALGCVLLSIGSCLTKTNII